MRYSKIEVIGAAGHSAVLQRQRGGEFIEVEVYLPGGTKRHGVHPSDREDQWSMAECLQQTLDGRKGAGGDIRDYFNAIQLLGDC